MSSSFRKFHDRYNLVTKYNLPLGRMLTWRLSYLILSNYFLTHCQQMFTFSRAHSRCDRSAVDAHFSMAPYPTFNFSRGPCMLWSCFVFFLWILNTVSYHHISCSLLSDQWFEFIFFYNILLVCLHYLKLIRPILYQILSTQTSQEASPLFRLIVKSVPGFEAAMIVLRLWHRL